MIVNDAPDQEVYVIGKSVVVNKRAKGVLAVGGDVIVEGRVEGDVATVGGNVIQKKDAYIGGDIIVFGGAYKPEIAEPLREPGRETVMFGVFEEELRGFGQDPTQIFSPELSVAFIAQRLVLALFWFIISIVMTTIAPGAVGRAVARIHLSWLKVVGLGAGAFLLLIGAVIIGAVTLPNYLSATLALMGMLLLTLAYVFGRVSLQVSTGKLLQKYLLPDNNRSETLLSFRRSMLDADTLTALFLVGRPIRRLCDRHFLVLTGRYRSNGKSVNHWGWGILHILQIARTSMEEFTSYFFGCACKPIKTRP